MGENKSKKKKKNKKKAPKSESNEQEGDIKAQTADEINKDKGAEVEDEVEGNTSEGKKKKRSRGKKKPAAESSETKSSVFDGQTDPPTVPIVQLYPDGNFPIGEIMDYPIVNDNRTAKDRFTSEEKKALDRSQNDIYNEARCAGIGSIFGSLIIGYARNPSLKQQLFSYAILGFALSEAMGLFCLMMAFLLLFAF